MQKNRETPEFTSEAEARAFWESHDSSPYLDWQAARAVTLPNLKPSDQQS